GDRRPRPVSRRPHAGVTGPGPTEPQRNAGPAAERVHGVSQLPDSVGLLGAGRMGRGIALSCALAGVRAVLLDMKERPQGDFDRMAADCRRELHTDLASMAELGLFEARHLETIAGRIS